LIAYGGALTREFYELPGGRLHAEDPNHEAHLARSREPANAIALWEPWW
jgi:hypothetical protein